MQSRKLLILSLLALLALASCNLGSKSIFAQVGDFEKVDYNTDSPLYKGSTTGVAYGGGNLFVTSSRRLWRQNANGDWADLTGSLPSPFNSAVDIVQLKGEADQAYLALGNDGADRLGIYTLDLSTSKFSQVGSTINGQQPNRFFKIQDTAGDITKAFLYAQPTGDNPNAKYVYDVQNFSDANSNVGPVSDEGKFPGSQARVIGILNGNSSAPYKYVVTLTFNNTEQSQIWTSDKVKPVNIDPNYAIRLAGEFPVRNTTGTMSPVVSALSGATFVFSDIAKGKLETKEDKVITGLGSSLQPNFYGFIGGVPVIATNFGYFETNDGKNLTFPTDKTTDVSSYTASQISTMNVKGIFTTSDKKVYLTTWTKGLWVRDPATKKWSSV